MISYGKYRFDSRDILFFIMILVLWFHYQFNYGVINGIKKKIYLNLHIPGVLRAAMNHRGGLRSIYLTIFHW